MRRCPQCGERIDASVCPACLTDTIDPPDDTTAWDRLTKEQREIDALMRTPPGGHCG